MYYHRKEGRGSFIESLEGRLLLSRTSPINPILRSQSLVIPPAKPTVILKGAVPAPSSVSPMLDASTMTLSAPFNPSQIRGAYGVNNISFGGTAGDGSGQTIAIIDAYNTPSILADAATFSSQWGLPQFNVSGGPALTILNQNGMASPLPANATPAGSWDLEASLDVQWVHAIAPKANIILFESDNNGGGLYTAVATAAAYPGVSAVSMSWGSGEFNGETTLDSTFTTPGGHPGVTFLASTGDSGAPGSYPAYSPNIVAVGGTSLKINDDGSWGGESGWGSTAGKQGGGGGISLYESQPSYQTDKINGLSSTQRTQPDLAMNANPSTGVYVLDSYYGGSGAWYQVGGTSLACPTTAALVAIANQGRSLAGLSSLNGRSQTLPSLYNMAASNYHDVISGSNGFSAGAGYDLVTGLGTPIANSFVPSLAGIAGTISGQVFQDSNSNGAMDSGEPAVNNAIVYIDLNNNSIRDSGEPSVATSGSGGYAFSGLGAGTYTIREIPPTGYIATGSSQVILNTGQNFSNINLSAVATAYTGTAGNDQYLLRLDGTGTNYQIFVNGTLSYTINLGLTSQALTFSLGAGDDSLTIDYSNGDPVPAGGIIYSGGTAINGNALDIIGANPGDTFSVTPSQITHAATAISYVSVNSLSLSNGSFGIGSDLNGISLGVGANASVQVAASQHLASLSMSGGTLTTPAGAGIVLVTSNLVWTSGTLDLTDNDMIVRNGTAGTWNGTSYDGITGLIESGALMSSSAASRTTTLGVATAGDALSISGTQTASFDGETVNPGDVLIKFTYVGDANLDGKVNIDDYGRIDGSVGASGLVFGWFNGDFNFDGMINIDDYGLIDGVIGTQGAVL